MSNLEIDGNSLKIEDIINIPNNSVDVILSDRAKEKMLESRKIIEKIIAVSYTHLTLPTKA